MTGLPSLGPRAIDAYNRFAKELAAFNYVLRKAKPAGPVSAGTLLTLNGLINLANRLFRRHADLPRFIQVDTRVPMAQADLAVLVARLTAASLHFEERYAHLKTGARGSGSAALYAREGLPSPHL